MNRIIAIIAVCFLSGFGVHAQFFCNFQNYSRQDGLSDDFIFSLAQDTSGYIWMSTSYGLNRFDGLVFHPFIKSEQTHQAVLRNDFNCVFSDSKGRVWFGSHNGTIMMYNQHKDMFENKSFSFDYHLEYPSISKFYESKNTLYALTTHGVLKYKEETASFEFFCKKFPVFNQIHIISMLQDEEGNFWFGTAKNGLLYVDSQQKNLKVYPLQDELGILRIPTFCKIHANLMYVGTSRGIYELHPQSHVLVKSNDFPEIEQNYITSIVRDSSRNIWIGTNYNGLWVYDYNNLFYKIEEYQTEGVKIASINSILCDTDNSIWVATQGNGLFLFNPAKNKVQHTSMDVGLAHNVVSTITEDARGNIWVGTDGGGISIFSPRYGYVHEIQTPYIPSNSVLAFAKRSADEVWACMWGSGIMKIDMLTKTVTPYNLSQPEITNNLIKTICFYDNTTLWVGTYGNGVQELDITTGKLKRKTTCLDTLFKTDRQKFINQIIRDKKGNMWVASLRTVHKISAKSSQLILNFDNDKLSFFPGYIHTIAEDNSGNIIIGTNRGVFVYSNQGELLTELSKTIPELNGTEILSLHCNANNQYWIATTNGLFVYNTDSKKYEIYFVDNYSKGNFYTARSVYQDTQGRIHWGTMNGFYSFYPNSLQQKHTISNVLFSDLFISYQKQSPNTENYNTHISLLTELELSYKQHIWGVSFDAICYNAPDAVEFAYKLEGFDKDWNTIGNKRDITFTNIPPGTYTLYVKAWINNQDEAKIIDILVHITPPWWKTWWFKILLFIIISAALYGIYYIRIYTLKTQKEKLEAEVKRQTLSITEQKKHIEEQNVELQQANDTKNYLFSIVAHDLRNSFTSLHGFSELLHEDYDSIKEKEKRDYIALIKQSATVIYNLLENLLSWSRSQTRSIECNPEICQVYMLAERVVELYTLSAQEKHITLRNDIPKHLYVYVDKEMIITGFRNICNNAIKFTPLNGSVIFSAHEYSEYIEVSIRDTGLGISAEDLQSLFVIKPSTSYKRKKMQGSGLGLIVSKEFIEKNNGTILVTSEIDKGSEFIIRLPKNSTL
ncbi:MAG TPA: two-component regulator propeller domain-containing protein [Bacteroidales bacterium]|nr:two-component regulator propeller domain-containing protein [Bacteroidales bacterium]